MDFSSGEVRGVEEKVGAVSSEVVGKVWPVPVIEEFFAQVRG